MELEKNGGQMTISAVKTTGEQQMASRLLIRKKKKKIRCRQTHGQLCVCVCVDEEEKKMGNTWNGLVAQ